MAMTDQQKDETFMIFLGMTEDRVDPEVARSLLEAVGWDLTAASNQLFGDGLESPAASRPPSALLPQHPAGAPPDRDRDMPVDFDAGSAVLEDDMGDLDLPMPREIRPTSAGGEQDTDAQLAAAIAASYQSQTHAGREQSEEELIEQALRMSQQEEDQRMRQELRSQQEAELQESMLMDQMREQQEREAREAAAALEQAEGASRLEAERKAREDLEAKKARLPDEPPAADPSRVAIMLRLPNGHRLQRAFRSSEVVGTIYDFLDLQNEELAGQQYRLVSTMPRKAYEDRQPTLQEAGIQNQFVLMVELQSG